MQKSKNLLAKPFVKWAGGKSQLIPEISKKYPAELGKQINKYCEPFVGGGAVLFDVLSKYNLKQVMINDINKDLINTYKQIKNRPEKIIEELYQLQGLYHPLSSEERKKIYYEKRERFNLIKINGDETKNIESAVLFIFLNKTCFNGLYRVNKKGLFNVPIGSYKKPPICDEDNIKKTSILLQHTEIKCEDFENCLDFIDNRTFVYIDPPYRPLNQTSSFNAYDDSIFDDNEQMRLRNFMDSITEKNARTILSNSDPKNIDTKDNFFDDLYRHYKIKRISAKRMINSVAKSRGSISELLISN
jgi:DNA adenine methylase